MTAFPLFHQPLQIMFLYLCVLPLILVMSLILLYPILLYLLEHPGDCANHLPINLIMYALFFPPLYLFLVLFFPLLTLTLSPPHTNRLQQTDIEFMLRIKSFKLLNKITLGSWFHYLLVKEWLVVNGFINSNLKLMVHLKGTSMLSSKKVHPRIWNRFLWYIFSCC